MQTRLKTETLPPGWLATAAAAKGFKGRIGIYEVAAGQG